MGRGTNLSEATKAEILRLSCEGKSGAEIGRTLGIDPGTVTHFIGRYRLQQIRTCEYCGKAIKDSEAVCEFPSTQRDVIFKAIAEVSKIAKKMEGGK